MSQITGAPLVEAPLPDPYEVVSISLVSAPQGLSGSDWHRYEISQGSNRIVGYRVGATEYVREAVEAIVEDLNSRRRGRRGRVQMVLRSRGSKRSGAEPAAGDSDERPA